MIRTALLLHRQSARCASVASRAARRAAPQVSRAYAAPRSLACLSSATATAAPKVRACSVAPRAAALHASRSLRAAEKVLVPQMGDSITDGELGEWQKSKTLKFFVKSLNVWH